MSKSAPRRYTLAQVIRFYGIKDQFLVKSTLVALFEGKAPQISNTRSMPATNASQLHNDPSIYRYLGLFLWRELRLNADRGGRVRLQ